MDNSLIKRQDAIDALEREKTYCTAYRDGYSPINVFEKYNDGLTDGIKALKNIPSAEPQWIPVSERLPEETGIYLVTLKTDGVAYFEDEFPHGFVYASAYEAVTMHWGYGDKNVIAWMPLPKSYEGDKE